MLLVLLLIVVVGTWFLQENPKKQKCAKPFTIGKVDQPPVPDFNFCISLANEDIVESRVYRFYRELINTQSKINSDYRSLVWDLKEEIEVIRRRAVTSLLGGRLLVNWSQHDLTRLKRGPRHIMSCEEEEPASDELCDGSEENIPPEDEAWYEMQMNRPPPPPHALRGRRDTRSFMRWIEAPDESFMERLQRPDDPEKLERQWAKAGTEYINQMDPRHSTYRGNQFGANCAYIQMGGDTSPIPGSPRSVRSLGSCPAQSPAPSPMRCPVGSPSRSPAQCPAQSPAQCPVQSPEQCPAPTPWQSPVQSLPQRPLQPPAQCPVKTPPPCPVQTPAQPPCPLGGNVARRGPTRAPTPPMDPVLQQRIAEALDKRWTNVMTEYQTKRTLHECINPRHSTQIGDDHHPDLMYVYMCGNEPPSPIGEATEPCYSPPQGTCPPQTPFGPLPQPQGFAGQGRGRPSSPTSYFIFRDQCKNLVAEGAFGKQVLHPQGGPFSKKQIDMICELAKLYCKDSSHCHQQKECSGKKQMEQIKAELSRFLKETEAPRSCNEADCVHGRPVGDSKPPDCCCDLFENYMKQACDS